MPDWLGPQNTTNVVPASGTLVVELNHQKPNIIWQVEQVTASVGPASTSGQLGVFKNGYPIGPAAVLAPLVSPAGAPSISQTFAGDPYVYIEASDKIQVVVTGATPGDTVIVRGQYREFNKNDPSVAGVQVGA